MRYCIGNLSREEVEFVHQIVRNRVTAPEGVDLDNLVAQSGAPIAQDELTGEVMAALVFGEDDDGG